MFFSLIFSLFFCSIFSILICSEVVILVSSFFFLLLLSKGSETQLEMIFFSDKITFVTILLSLFVTFLGGATLSLLKEKGKMSVFSFTSMIMIIFFFSSNPLFLFIFFELSLIPVFFMVVGWGAQPERLKAGKFMALYTLIASFPLFFLFIFFFLNTPGWTGSSFTPSFLLVDWKWISFFSQSKSLLFFAVLAFFVKTPVFFFHSWLPKAHVEATITGSMILAGTMLKMGVYGLIRIFSFFANFYMITFFLSVCICGALISSSLSLSVDDMKQTVAFSSVSHMNFCAAVLMTFSELGKSSCVLILFTHALSSCGLFYLVTKCYSNSGSRSVSVSKGVLSLAPSLSLISFICWAISMAAPPSLTFSSEVLGLSSISSKSFYFIFLSLIFVLVNSFFSMFNFGVLSNSGSKIFLKDEVSLLNISIGVFVSFPLIVLFFFPSSIFLIF
nr:NADH dehydrogenase subunit 4 [Oxylipeurus chiniri]